MQLIFRILFLITLILFSGCTHPSDQQFLAGTVEKVIDGDTANIKINGKEEKVRLIGIDTPETHHPTKPVEPYGLAAENYTRSQLAGKTVYLELDVTERDRYGRLLAYIWTSPPSSTSDSEIRAKMFNAGLVLNGYAQILTIPPNVRYASNFKKYQTEARESAKGLWGLPSPAPVPPPLPPSPTTVVIESIDLIEELAVIKNYGSTSVSLTGWTLVSVTGSQTFTFPDPAP